MNGFLSPGQPEAIRSCFPRFHGVIYIKNQETRTDRMPARLADMKTFGEDALFSTLYHSITNIKAKSILRIFDHSSIYLLIAGTYTPIILIVFSSPKRYYFLFATWAIALGGILFKIFTHGKYEKYAKVSLFLYILMGWISLLLIRPIIRYGTFRFFFWILAGGIIYTLGTIFFEMKKVKYSHFIWHLFVLTASIFHIIGIYKYLI